MAPRPAVSVIVPFAGSIEAARALLAGLERLSIGEDDELIVVDNSPLERLPAAAEAGSPIVVRAAAEQSSYYARNAGAERATNGWLLFLDADCRPAPDLLDRYFETPVGAGCALIAGGLAGPAQQPGTLPGWARSRRQLSEEHLLGDRSLPYPAAGTGNLLVRRRAFEALGGFHEGIRSGGDVELCWRLQEAGWELLHRPAARVEHVYGTDLRTFVAQAVRHAAGRRWINRRYPGAFPRPAVARELGRSLAGTAVWAVTLRPRRSLYKLIDGIVLGAGAWGWWLGRNRAPRPNPPAPPVAAERSLLVLTDAFPARSETFVYNECLRLIAQGWRLRIESLARPARCEREVARRLRIDYLEDDPPRDKLRDLFWLLSRHPLRCLRDRLGARRWALEEEVWPLAALAPAARRLAGSGERHLHAHFAAGGALTAMRIGALLGLRFGLTAHAYDIFQRPRNLPEKLRRASFAAAECEYAAARLREIAGPRAASRVHRIATGVDGGRFRRSSPYPDGGRVLAIGRLVEKKGFEHLIRAAQQLPAEASVSEVAIAGEGPLAGELEDLVTELGVGDRVRLLGALWGPNAVREMLETADLLAIPSVIAADGDRDALPLVAYEALAMEVPVVASDLVGLPELVREPWGRLVEPGRPRALAEAISTVLSLPAEERARAGGLGREFVLERFDPERETARLAGLIAAG